MQLDFEARQTVPALAAVRFQPEVITGIVHDLQEKADCVAEFWLFGHYSAETPTVLIIQRYQRFSDKIPVAPDLLGTAQATPGPQAPTLPRAEFDGIFVRIFPDSRASLVAEVFVRGTDVAAGLPDFSVPFSASISAPVSAQSRARVVADFEASPPVPRLPRELPPRQPAPELDEPERGWLRRSMPFLGAIVLIGSLLGLFTQFQPRKGVPLPAPVGPGQPRPLGLFVDPAKDLWRISWNRDATMLHDAAGVRLFVQDGEEHFTPDLPAQDLDAGETHFRPRSKDITFRLEATAKDGRVSAESFRILQSAVPAAAPAPAALPPQVKFRVAPSLGAGVRGRIKGRIGIDVRVTIDQNGRVVSSRPTVKPAPGLQTYLTGRAQRAARSWRFEPATQNGQAVPGHYTIHFTFDR